jgi:hypothetical protein
VCIRAPILPGNSPSCSRRRATPIGDILAFNDADVFGYAGRYKGGAVRDALFSIPKKSPTIADPRGATGHKKEKKEKKGKNEKKEKKRERKAANADKAESPVAAMRLKYHWVKKCPPEIAAMAIAGKTLFAAGVTEGSDPKLLAFTIEDGQLLSESPLPATPVFGGMAVAQSRLYLTFKDGSVLCLEPTKLSEYKGR